MRFLITCCLVLCFSISIPVVAQSQDPDVKPDSTRQASTHQINKLIKKRLTTPIKVDFTDAEFGDILTELRKQTGVEFHIDQSGVDAGLGPDDLASMNAQGMTLRSALRLFLRKYDCTYIVKDEVVILLTTDQAEHTTLTEVFHCQNLTAKLKPTVVEIPFYQGRPINHLHFDEMKSARERHIHNASRIQDSKKKTDVNQKNHVVENGAYFVFRKELSAQQHLVHLIQTTVEPESWQIGGGEGSIAAVNNILIIRQTGEVMAKVETFLGLLEAELK